MVYTKIISYMHYVFKTLHLVNHRMREKKTVAKRIFLQTSRMKINPEAINQIGCIGYTFKVLDEKTNAPIIDPKTGQVEVCQLLERFNDDARIYAFGELLNDEDGPRYAVTLKISSFYEHLDRATTKGIIHIPKHEGELDNKQLVEMDKEIGALVNILVELEPNPIAKEKLREAFIDELGHGLRRSNQITYDKYIQRQRKHLPFTIRRWMKKWGDAARMPEPETKMIECSVKESESPTTPNPRRYSQKFTVAAVLGLVFAGAVSTLIKAEPDRQKQYTPAASRHVQEVSYEEPRQKTSYPLPLRQASFPRVLPLARSTEYIGFQQQKPLEFVLMPESDYSRNPTPTTLNGLARAVLGQLHLSSEGPSLEEAIEFDNRINQEYKTENFPSIVNKNEGPDDEYDMKLDNALFQKGFILLEPESVLSSEPEPPFQGDFPGDKKIIYH